MAKARKPVPGQVGELASCHRVLDSLGLRKALKPYRPRIVGSMPLGLRTADSDIDVLVEVADLDAFARQMQEAHGAQEDFVMYRRAGSDDDGGAETLVVRIETAAWPVEITGSGPPNGGTGALSPVHRTEPPVAHRRRGLARRDSCPQGRG